MITTTLLFKGWITIKKATKEKISTNSENIHVRRIHLAKSSNLHDICDERVKLLIHNTSLLTSNRHILSSNKSIETWLNNSLETPIICNKVSASNLDNQ